MKNLYGERDFGKLKLKNPLVLPSMVAFGFADDNGYVSERNIEHYDRISKNGAGLVIVEATCINPEGRLSIDQLAIWDDSYVEGLKRLSSVIHKNGAIAIIQLHHAGLRAKADVTETPLTSWDFEQKGRVSKGMTKDQVEKTIEDFSKAAKRAQMAGFDGVEIHGAHGYLLTQFFSKKVNARTDEYGGSHENRNRIAKKIHDEIRKETGEDFILGIRMGSNDDTIEESIERAKYLEKNGYDYLHVSTGFDNTQIEAEIPEEFPCNWIVYGGTLIKKNVEIPVIGVNKILTRKQVDYLLENQLLDLVAIGRAQLADHDFIEHMTGDGEIVTCLECSPCKWFSDGTKCPRHM
ncbi:NADH:flavin oxidoreductase [Gudongella sp. SC589]|uniref:NADH:flavin oxidoreductase n=1 Tax=Gudongella sp. SC589 TaxID=3385990 RepID=UPI003904DC3B